MVETIDNILEFYPFFLDEIKGCSTDEIQILQDKVTQPLFISYIEFLECMGHTISSLKMLSDHSDFSYTAILQHYSRNIPDTRPYFLFGYADYPGEGIYMGVYLDLSYHSEPPIVYIELPDDRDPNGFTKASKDARYIYSSLHQLVFAEAFFKWQLNRFIFSTILNQKETVSLNLDQLHRFLKEVGFRHHPQSCRHIIKFYIKDNTIIILKNDAKNPFEEDTNWSLWIYANSKEETMKYAKKLAHFFPLTIIQ